MINFYVHKNQLYNFIILKEPVVLLNDVLDSDHFLLCMDINKLILKQYRTYTTVELKTFRKRLESLWKKKN